MQLNEEIAELQKKNHNIMSSEEVRKKLEKKDNEIKELYSLINQYSKSNKMVETLSEQIAQKEE